MDAARPRFVVALAGGLLLYSTLAAAPPVGWRTDGSGAYPDAVPPTDWKADHVVWKTKLPGNSYGSPVLAGDCLFFVSDLAELLCVNAADGKVLWQRSHALDDLYDADTAKTVHAEFVRLKAEKDRLRRERDREKDDPAKKADLGKQLEAAEKAWLEYAAKYPAPPALGDRGSTNSAATPITDGDTVYALFGNGIACAYARDGKKLWARHVEASPIHFGHASSPVLVDGKLLVHLKDLVALDAKTGEEVWRDVLSPNYATSVPTKAGTAAVVVSPSGAVVRVSDGKVLVKSDKLRSSECTPILRDGTLYTFDSRARALRLLPAGEDAVKLEQLWESRISGGRRTPSAAWHDGLLYAVTTDGKLDVLDARTGEGVYQERLNVGDVYASATGTSSSAARAASRW